MVKKILLTKQKSNWVKNRDVTLRGKTLHYNSSNQEKYLRSLNRLVNKMTEETKKKLIVLFKSNTANEFFEKQKQSSAMDESISSQARILMNSLMDKFSQLFSFESKTLAEIMIKNSDKASKANLHSSLKQLSGGLSLKTGIVSKGMEEISKAILAENVSLIRSIPEKYFKDITGSVMRSITIGNGFPDLIFDLNKYSNQTKRRVKNLALDQTRKAYNSINKQRMQTIGVKQFEWVHSGGGQEPRQSHLKISGHIFYFDNIEKQQAALGVPESDRGIPGYPINCRCTILPIIKFENE